MAAHAHAHALTPLTTQVVRNLAPFLRARAFEPAPGASPADFSDDAITTAMNTAGYLRIDARNTRPRGARDAVTILVLAEGGKFTRHAPDLLALLNTVDTGAAAKRGALDELIVVTSPDAMGKTNLTAMFAAEFRAEGKCAYGVDAAGARARYTMLAYTYFALVVPEHVSVPPHIVLSDAEVQALLRDMRCSLANLPTILATDPPIVWNGAREGQVVKIIRDSPVAGAEIAYRQVRRA